MTKDRKINALKVRKEVKSVILESLPNDVKVTDKIRHDLYRSIMKVFSREISVNNIQNFYYSTYKTMKDKYREIYEKEKAHKKILTDLGLIDLEYKK